MQQRHQSYDCVIVGGGPAGLTAALYLARFRRSVALIDHGNSRARHIPQIRNLPGFPDGISGPDFLDALTRQLARYGMQADQTSAVSLGRTDEGFFVETATGGAAGRTVLLATGCEDVRPEIDDHDAAVRDGLLRYCPVCDGFEVAGQSVGLLVTADHAASKSRYLRAFTDRLDVHVVSVGAAVELERRGDGIGLRGHPATWNTVYAALGSKPQSWLSAELDIERNEDRRIVTRDHQLTSATGVYAIGDVVSGLDQIAVALGHAALAASHIHNRLLEQADEDGFRSPGSSAGR